MDKKQPHFETRDEAEKAAIEYDTSLENWCPLAKVLCKHTCECYKKSEATTSNIYNKLHYVEYGYCTCYILTGIKKRME